MATSQKLKILPAYHLTRTNEADKFVEDHVNEILGMIEDDIKYAVDQKQNNIGVELPTMFDIPTMNNSKAQKHVYFHTVRALKQAQYYPTLIFSKGKKAEEQQVFINVTWISKEEEEMEAYMDKFIKMHSVKSSKKKT